jgi:hypothetical protein
MVRIETRAEPIPGYRLIERLGGGGFGEVWKAEAPGGLLKAIKFVYGDLEDAGDDGLRAEQELKAMSRVKGVRHPYILSLERFDIIDGQLLIVTELADRNLWDRFRECRDEGLPGVPREEMLGYMEETAEALDLMNQHYQLQHLDIKPQNLFLVHNHIKVADFGLVKDLEGMVASVTGGVTPIYAAPETFDGYVSRFCDQYSLAIVYQELLTGRRPFAGTNVRQLILQHVQGTPDVSPLPEGDRPVVQRSLAKNPDDRFPCCRDMVRALRQGGAAHANRPGATPRSETDLDAGSTRTFVDAPLAAPPGDSSEDAARITPDSVQAVTHWIGQLNEAARAAPEAAPAFPIAEEIKGAGCLFPALVIGLGGGGLNVVQALRAGLNDAVGSLGALTNVRLLYLDTDPEFLHEASRGPAAQALTPDEVLLTRLKRPSHYLRPRGDRGAMNAWFNPRILYRMPRTQMTAGVRALGRLAFCDNHRAITRRLMDSLEGCTNQEALMKSGQETGLGVRDNTPRVYIVSGLAGGTGSGMFLDVAYVVRSLLRRLGYPRPEIVGVFLLPSTSNASSHVVPLGNTFAALTELRHFMKPGTPFSAQYEESEPVFNETAPPFTRGVFLPLSERSDDAAVRSIAGLAAEYLRCEIASPLGRVAEDERTKRADATDANAEPCWQSFGLYRFTWPRRALFARTARAVCGTIVEHWMTKDSKPLRDAVKQHIDVLFTEEQFTVDAFITHLQDACQKALGKEPESLFDEIIKPLDDLGANLSPSAIGETVGRLDLVFGRPDAEPPADGPVTVLATLARGSAALVSTWGQRLGELIVRFIEDPAFRLAGAEEANRQMAATLEQTLQNHESLCKEIGDRAAEAPGAARQMLANLLKLPPGSKKAGQAAAEIVELLRSYAKWRYQHQVLLKVLYVGVSLRGLLSDQLRDVNFCRNRLTELRRMLGTKAAEDVLSRSDVRRKSVLPSGCQTLEAAVEQETKRLTADDLRKLDQRLQAMIKQNFCALVHVCLGSANYLNNLMDAMLREGEAFMAKRVSASDTAAIYLQQLEPGGGAVYDVQEAYDEAAPLLETNAAADDAEVRLLMAPPGPAGEQWAALAREALPEANFTCVTGGADMVIYRETVHLDFDQLPQLQESARAAYEQLTAVEHFTPHSRVDIGEWATPVER